METLSSTIKNHLIAHPYPHVCSKPVWMSLLCWTQRKIFWRMWETEQFRRTFDFHSIFFPTMEVNDAQNSLCTNFLQNIFLCVLRNKDIHSLEILEGELNDSFHFWMNNPFKGKKVLTLKWNLKLTLNRAATKLFLFWLIYRLIFRLSSQNFFT